MGIRVNTKRRRRIRPEDQVLGVRQDRNDGNAHRISIRLGKTGLRVMPTG